MTGEAPLLEARGLTKSYQRGGRLLGGAREPIVAVEDVSFAIQRGESFGLVGESGCGKTTVARMLLRLIEPSGGSVWFDGAELTALDAGRLRALRPRLQMVFQDPYAALNPRKTLRQILSKPFALHTSLTREQRTARAVALLEDVGLVPARDFMDRYPHELSGGQRQRVVIARAIALDPDLIVADEPVSALDVSVRAQILNLLLRLKRKRRLTMLFISHDLSIVRALCERVAVMYLGRIIEVGSSDEVFETPLHPYTRALLAATPVPDPRRMRGRSGVVVEGEIPSALERPPGCLFSTRCPHCVALCTRAAPELKAVRSEHQAACHFADRGLPAEALPLAEDSL